MILLEINVLAVAVSVIVFLLVTMLLVSLLLFAKAKLIPEGTVKININGGDSSVLDLVADLTGGLTGGVVYAIVTRILNRYDPVPEKELEVDSRR